MAFAGPSTPNGGPGPVPRNLEGAWGWFALIVVLGIFNTVLGEELLFRGFLLPRMNGAFGRVD